MDKQPQTISFELAKELEKLGIKQDSYFYWLILPVYNTPELLTYKEYKNSIYETDKCELCPAYQLHEILEMLPQHITYKKDCEAFFDLYKCGSNTDYLYEINYSDIDNNILNVTDKDFEEENPAEAAGNLLLWCIENKYIKI
jgi:hypothetical protein